MEIRRTLMEMMRINAEQKCQMKKAEADDGWRRIKLFPLRITDN